MHYISEGTHYSLNTTGEANFISSKARKKQQLANVSVNSAQIIEHMKRQNLNSETLHKLLVQTTNSTSTLIPQINNPNNASSVVVPKSHKVKKTVNSKLQSTNNLHM